MLFVFYVSKRIALPLNPNDVVAYLYGVNIAKSQFFNLLAMNICDRSHDKTRSFRTLFYHRVCAYLSVSILSHTFFRLIYIHMAISVADKLRYRFFCNLFRFSAYNKCMNHAVYIGLHVILAVLTRIYILLSERCSSMSPHAVRYRVSSRQNQYTTKLLLYADTGAAEWRFSWKTSVI